jgi:SAM-dependent methyltransferase
MSEHLAADPTERFSGRAADYVRYRPGYPDDAIAAVLDGLGDPGELTVVDVGAGTGISTRLLVERGAHVVALEPNDDMRAALADAGCDVHNGRAEATGLPDQAYDLVTAFQAFHWFANAAALAEFKRILRPGGRIALVWNIRDDRDPFTRGYGDIFDREREREIERTFQFDWSGVEEQLRANGVRNVRKDSFTIVQRLNLEGVLGRASSASYVPKEGPHRDHILDKLTAMHEQYADSAGFIELHYRTDVYRGET